VTLDEAANIADAICPEVSSKTPNHRLLNSTRLDVVVGLMHELPVLRPSSTEVAAILCCSHSTVLKYRERWLHKPWRERHGWLVLAEGRAE
jgi:hypothetical protein